MRKLTQLAALWLTAAALLLVAAPATAQGANKRSNVEERLNKVRRKVLKKKVGLSDAKVDAVEAAFTKFRTKRSQLKQQTKSARRALRRLARADSSDQAAYSKAIDAFLANRRAMRKLEDEQLAALRKILTPKEQVRLLHASMKLKRKLRKARRRARRQRK